MAAQTSSKPTRVPADERRDALITASVHEFARTGLHGTPVDRIAARVGIPQPYVFKLFGTKRDLFLAAVERGFHRASELFARAADEFVAGRAPQDCEDSLQAMGRAYREMLESEQERDWLMIQHQAYAACDDDVVRERVRELFAELVTRVHDLSGEDVERLDDFFRWGSWLNVAAALRVEGLSLASAWIVRHEATRPASSTGA